MKRILFLLLSFSLLVGCETPQSPPIPPPLTNAPTLPPREWSVGITVNLPFAPTGSLKAKLDAVGTPLGGNRWGIKKYDRDNDQQQDAIEHALRVGATLTQFVMP